MLTEPVSMSGISGTVDTDGSMVAVGHNTRVSLQVSSWTVPLHIGLGSSPAGRVPDAVVPASSMWEPPAGLTVQQDLYIASSSGTASYQVTEFRR